MASRLDPETGKRKSVCGTQRYMAPEMKAKQPYDESVDWCDTRIRLTPRHRSSYGQSPPPPQHHPTVLARAMDRHTP